MTDGIDMKAIMKLRETDIRARRMIDSAVVYALGERRGEIEDEQDARRFAYEVATVAVTGLLDLIYRDDGELRRLREERDHYKSLAEKSLLYATPHVALRTITDA